MVQARNALSLCSYFLPTGIPSFNLDFASLRRFSRTERTSLRYSFLRYSFEIFSGFLNRPEAPQSEDRKRFQWGIFETGALFQLITACHFFLDPSAVLPHFGQTTCQRTEFPDLIPLRRGFAAQMQGLMYPSVSRRTSNLPYQTRGFWAGISLDQSNICFLFKGEGKQISQFSQKSFFFLF